MHMELGDEVLDVRPDGVRANAELRADLARRSAEGLATQAVGCPPERSVAAECAEGVGAPEFARMLRAGIPIIGLPPMPNAGRWIPNTT